jgi:L-rhamnose mutarotase
MKVIVSNRNPTIYDKIDSRYSLWWNKETNHFFIYIKYHEDKNIWEYLKPVDGKQ